MCCAIVAHKATGLLWVLREFRTRSFPLFCHPRRGMMMAAGAGNMCGVNKIRTTYLCGRSWQKERDYLLLLSLQAALLLHECSWKRNCTLEVNQRACSAQPFIRSDRHFFNFTLAQMHRDNKKYFWRFVHLPRQQNHVSLRSLPVLCLTNPQN